MEPSGSPIPKIELQSPAVDFIDNRLPKYHPAFANRSARYDPNLGRYVAASKAAKAMPDAPEVAAPAADLGEGIRAEDMALPPRPLPSPIAVMKFWDSIFDDSMKQFNDIVKGVEDPVEPQHSIRNEADWEGIYNQLEVSRNKYNSIKGIPGFAKKIYRKMAENCQPLIQTTKFVPQNEYTTPVLGAVQLLLEAVELAGKTRKKILGGFDELDVIFSEVELFLEIFPDDENIRKSSVELIAIVFRAVEQAIFFFTKSWGRRAVGAIFKKDDYQGEIVGSIEMIEERSNDLVRQATNSFIQAVSQAMFKVHKRIESWASEYQMVLDRLERLQQGQERLEGGMERGFGHIAEAINWIESQLAGGVSLNNSMLLVLEELPKQLDDARKYNEELKKNRDEYESKMKEVIHLYEDLRSFSPLPGTASAWQPPSNVPRYISPEELWKLLSVPRLELEDLEFVNSRRGLVPSAERARTEQLVKCRQFLEWAVSPISMRLLVHGNFSDRSYVSALSLFCATLLQSLNQTPSRFIPLIFFCGRHVNTLTDPYAGGRALIKSFISQLLWQRQFDTNALQPDDAELVRRGDIGGLCRLFWWLVAQLPTDQTVFLLIDGVGYYEREDFEVDADFVLGTLLTPPVDGDMALVKAILTHPSGTRRMRERVESKWTISMAAMAAEAGTGNGRRLERGLRDIGTGG